MKPLAGGIDFVYQQARGVRKSTVNLFDRDGAQRRREANRAWKRVGVDGGVADRPDAQEWTPDPAADASTLDSRVTSLTPAQQEYAIRRFEELKVAQQADREAAKKRREELRLLRKAEAAQLKENKKRAKAARKGEEILDGRVEVDQSLVGDENGVVSKGSI